MDSRNTTTTSNTTNTNTTNSDPMKVSVTTPSATTMSQNPVASKAMQGGQMLGQGQMPSNAQIQQGINNTQAALKDARHDAPLSSKGQVLVEDANQLLNAASRMLQEKNSDGKFQRLYASGFNAGRDTRTGVSGVSTTDMPVGRGDLSQMRGNARGMFDAGKSLAMFAVRSGQFREILVECLDVLQNILGTAQTKIATDPSMTNAAKSMGNETLVEDQQRQQLWNKFRTLLSQLGDRPEYYTAVDHIFQITDFLAMKGRMMKEHAQTQTQTGNVDVPKDQYNQMWCDTKCVVEEFSGVGTMDTLEQRSMDLFYQMKDDTEAQNWFREFQQYVMECMRDPHSLSQDNSPKSGYGRELMDRGRVLFQGKYRPYFSDVFTTLRMIITNIRNDSTASDFSQKLQKLGADFAFDANGRPDIFVIQESLSQMRTLLVPVLTANLRNLPIPKVEGSNAKYDFSVEGLILNIADILPDYFNLRTKTDTTLATQRLSKNKASTKVILEVDRIKAFFKDIRFFYRRKTMPRIEDHGVCDVDISRGTGLSLKVVWKVAAKTDEPLAIRLLKVKCNIDRLAITVKSAKHKILDKLATKIFAGMIKKQICNAIVKNVINALQPVNAKINTFFKRRPTTGIAERINTGMKSTLFTGNSDEQSLISKAKAAVNTGIDQARTKATDMKQAHNDRKETRAMNTTTTTSSTLNNFSTYNDFETFGDRRETYYVSPYESTNVMGTWTPIIDETEVFVAKAEPTMTDDLTFTERSKPNWAFEWYAPSNVDTVESVTSSLDNAKLYENTNTNRYATTQPSFSSV